jgi:hypothetical protein
VKGQRIGIRRVLYALPGEEWRIDAYLLLWKTAEKSGWNERFARLEGTLLGYEDWQNDYHIEHFFRKGNGAGPIAWSMRVISRGAASTARRPCLAFFR